MWEGLRCVWVGGCCVCIGDTVCSVPATSDAVFHHSGVTLDHLCHFRPGRETWLQQAGEVETSSTESIKKN